jgi:hypothetical protein
MTAICGDCHRGLFDNPKVRMAPVLHDQVWCRLARFDETLCGTCMFKRAGDRHIKLALADLLPCPFNLYHAPASWFELFASDEPAPPPNLSQWMAASRSLSPRLLRWAFQTKGNQTNSEFPRRVGDPDAGQSPRSSSN